MLREAVHLAPAREERSPRAARPSFVVTGDDARRWALCEKIAILVMEDSSTLEAVWFFARSLYWNCELPTDD